jgi:uncharacterized membrane protein YkoI
MIISGGVAVIALGLGIAGAVTASQAGDENEQPIRGAALDRATEAALAHMGGGTVTGTEVGDEDSLYEVEITLDSGRQVDVQLDENFEVVSADTDVENESGTD